jgi:hypothetical protein
MSHCTKNWGWRFRLSLVLKANSYMTAGILRKSLYTQETHTRMRIQFVVCLKTDLQPLPKRVLHRGRPSSSSFSFQYPVLSLRSSSSCLHLLPLLLVTSVLPPVTCLRRHFIRKMWPIQLALQLFIIYRVSHSTLTLSNTSVFTRSFQMISILLQSSQFKISPVFIYLIQTRICI